MTPIVQEKSHVTGAQPASRVAVRAPLLVSGRKHSSAHCPGEVSTGALGSRKAVVLRQKAKMPP
jgi:hypothetical protein